MKQSGFQMLEDQEIQIKGVAIKAKTNGKRILMSERNTALALQTVKELKEKNCKINLSELMNEIIEIYFKQHLERSRKSLEKKYFDRKKYVKSLLLMDSGVEFDESLKNLVKKISSKPKAKGADNDLS